MRKLSISFLHYIPAIVLFESVFLVLGVHAEGKSHLQKISL